MQFHVRLVWTPSVILSTTPPLLVFLRNRFTEVISKTEFSVKNTHKHKVIAKKMTFFMECTHIGLQHKWGHCRWTCVYSGSNEVPCLWLLFALSVGRLYWFSLLFGGGSTYRFSITFVALIYRNAVFSHLLPCNFYFYLPVVLPTSISP